MNPRPKYNKIKEEEYEFIILNWDTMDTREIAEKLMLSINQVNGMVFGLRKNGFKLKSKLANGKTKEIFSNLAKKYIV